MKTIAARDQVHLDSGSLTTATLWKLTRRDGQSFGFTDHDRDIVFGGFSYDAETSFNRSATADQAGYAPANLVIESILDSTLITEDDILAGLWDYAELEIRTVNWRSLQTRYITAISQGNPGIVTAPQHDFITGDQVTITKAHGMTQVNGSTYTITVLNADTFSIGIDTVSYGTYTGLGEANIPETSWGYRKGRIGQVNTSGQSFTSEFLGLTKQLEKPLVRPYLPACAAALGDSECTVNLAAHTITGTLETVDVTGLALGDATNITAAVNTYAYGLITMTSGASNGYSMEIKSSTVGGVILQQPLPFGVSVGDTYSLVKGCNKTDETCRDTFNNIVNFRGFPHLPGMDKVIQFAN